MHPPYQVTDQSVIRGIIVSIHTKLSTGTTQVLHRLGVEDYEAPIKYYLDPPKYYRVNTYLQSYPQMAVTKLCISTELSTE